MTATRAFYHNIEQNKRVRFAADLADALVTDGFIDGFEDTVWLSTKPLGDGCGTFTGVVVFIPKHIRLAQYRQRSDGLEDFPGVYVYAVPASLVNKYPRERWYPREGELAE